MLAWPSQSVCSLLHVLLLLLLLLTAFTQACPDQCACLTLPQGTRVHCRYQQLQAVPSGFPDDTFEIDFGHNDFAVITASSFPNLPNLKRLTLDYCHIQEVGEFAFSHFKSLQYLRLSDNEISSIDEQAFKGMAKLKELHLDRNSLNSIPVNLFDGLQLELLSLQRNGLQMIGKDMFKGAGIVSLNLDENRIGSMTKDCLSPLKETLKTLHLSHNQQPLTLQEGVLSDFNLSDLTVTFAGVKDSSFLRNVRASSLDISGNPFITLNFEDCENLRDTKEIYLRNLSIGMVDEELLSVFTSVTKLDLSSNKIFFINGEAFRQTPHLISLDLSGNSVDSLPDNFGKHMSKLESLDLTHNKLTKISTNSFTGLSSLKILALQHNKLQVLPESMRELLNQLDEVNLSDNPLHCNCEMRWFRIWLDETNMFTGAEDCFSPMRGVIWLYEPDEFVCRGPNIISVTQNMNVNQDEDVFLYCSAEGDPTPQVEWSSPFGEVVSTLPPSNRTFYKNTANWRVTWIQEYQSGWYRCKASNVEGEAVKYMYINVVTTNSTPIDVATLTYPINTTSTMAPTTASSPTTVAETTTNIPSTLSSTTSAAPTTVAPTTEEATTVAASTTMTSPHPTTSSPTTPLPPTTPSSTTSSTTTMPSTTSSTTSSPTTLSSISSTTSLPTTLSSTSSSTSSTTPSTVIVASTKTAEQLTSMSQKGCENVTTGDTALSKPANSGSTTTPDIRVTEPHKVSTLPQWAWIVVIVCSVLVVCIIIIIGVVWHILRRRRCKAYEITRTSETTYNNNESPVSEERKGFTTVV